MEQKINVAELLKDCPQGMELDCTMFENLEFDRIEKDDGSGKYYIICRVKTKIGYNVHTFTEHGCYSSNNYAKCVIFPKGKTTWEELPKFKVGDKIKHKTRISREDIVTEIKNTHYILNDELTLPFVFQDEYELVANKFDLNTLVPYESKVLVRDKESHKWKPAIWGFYDKDSLDYQIRVVGGYIYRYCIPYDGNEHLLATTDDCDDYYKTWK